MLQAIYKLIRLTPLIAPALLGAATPPPVSFNAPLAMPLPGAAQVVTGDFNHDGKEDIAVLSLLNGNHNHSVVTILLGQGSGAFQQTAQYPVPNDFYSIVAADFNRDGNLDLVVSDSGAPPVILFGNGDGTFQPFQSLSAYQLWLAVGDINGDGNLDLVGANGTNITISLGNGDGTFQQPPITVKVGIEPVFVVIRDFNGDGNADLAVADKKSTVVWILLGNGDGTFRPPVSFPSVPNGITLIAADFNNDGHIDLAEAGNSGASLQISVLLGKGEGTFSSGSTYNVPSVAAAGLAAADFNGDGNADLASFGGIDNTAILILRGNGDGTFQAPLDYYGGPSPGVIAVGHFQSQASPDVVVTSSANPNAGMVLVFLNDGHGNLSSTVDLSATTAVELSSNVPPAIGDFNRDGHLDIALAAPSDSVEVLLGNGNGTFQPPVTYSVPLSATVLQAGDFNNDGSLDLAVGGEQKPGVSILLGNGDGTFRQSDTLHLDKYPKHFAQGDFNGDGNLDLAAVLHGDGDCCPILAILLGDGDGTFQPPVYSVDGDGAGSIVVADFDADGILDLALSDTDHGLQILLGNGDGTFRDGSSYQIEGNVLVGSDFNGDGKPDLAFVTKSAGTVSIMLGNGDGTFQPPVAYTAGYSPAFAAAADFNGDGIPDLAINLTDSAAVAILLGNGDGTFQSPIDFGAARGALTVGDFTGRGRLSLLVGDQLLLEGRP